MTPDQQKTAATILESKHRSENSIPTNTNSYFRSRICTVHHSLNPLVAAASPIFTIMSQVCYFPPDTDLNQLHQNLQHEIFAFESNASQQKYRPRIITAAKYALSCFIDEGIEKCPQFADQKWTPILNTVHDEQEDRWQFYVILEHTSSDPTTYIDLLELLYLCLSFGYEGQYKNNKHGFIIRENMINNLYKNIRSQRGNDDSHIIVNKSKKVQPAKTYILRQLATTAVMTLSLLGIILGGGYIFLQRSSHNLEVALAQMLQSTVQNKNPSLPKPSYSSTKDGCCTMNSEQST